MSEVVEVEPPPKIFGFDMVAQEREGHWRLPFGEWSLFMMPAVWPRLGKYWWEIGTKDGATTIESDYVVTPYEAAQAIEDYLTDLGNTIAEWHANAMRVAGADRTQ